METTWKRTVQKTAETTDFLIGNKILAKIASLEILPQNNSTAVTNEEGNIELDREIPRERYISSEKKTKLLINIVV